MIATYVADDSRRSWGRVVRARHYIAKPRFADELPRALAEAVQEGRAALAVGLGRSYGDTNLNPDGALIDVSAIDRIIAFDALTGVLRVEAGASLSDILHFSVPRGWFLSTTPGTRFVTIGGAVANDVHGKNHKRAGSLGCAVRCIGLVRSDRGVIEASADENPDLFAATIGGLGLTGVMAWIEIQLAPIASAYIDQEVVRFETLDGFFEASEASDSRFEHTVSWIDCTARGERLGAGVLTRGNWTAHGALKPHADKPPLSVPMDGTPVAFSAVPLRLFNAGYGALQRLQRKSRVHYAQHLFPLDGVSGWNCLYGSRGFYQYQCVVPEAAGREPVRALLQTIADARLGSPLVVLKTLGAKTSPGLLSFPMRGVTLAMDFPNAGARTHDLFARLDAIVREAGGRLYPAKDGRMPSDMFKAGFPRWTELEALKDPALSSAFWRRVTQ